MVAPFDVSVVIPVYNGERFVAKAIRSVLNQTLRPREVFVVDDSSDDGTPELAESISGITVIRNKTNMGPSFCRNLGAQQASAEWLAFLDADDQWDPTKIERQAQVASQTGAGLIYCGVRSIEVKTESVLQHEAQIFRSHDALRRALFLRNCLPWGDSTVLVKRELFRRVGGFDPQMRFSEDRDLWIRLAAVTTFAAVPEPQASCRRGRGGYGDNPEGIFQGGITVLTKNRHILFDLKTGPFFLSRAKATLYARRGIAYMVHGNINNARRDLMRSALMWPFRLRTLVPLVKICAGLVREE